MAIARFESPSIEYNFHIYFTLKQQVWGWSADGKPIQRNMIQQKSYETADSDYATKNDRRMQESKAMKQIEKMFWKRMQN